ncbi:MAG: hypothetical protein EOP50_06240 [Sphingobacteriales bacterium]|nr:MAG: hypothetical protein EOP50_06240 [Sphingobacteriales bacterium]
MQTKKNRELIVSCTGGSLEYGIGALMIPKCFDEVYLSGSATAEIKLALMELRGIMDVAQRGSQIRVAFLANKVTRNEIYQTIQAIQKAA